MRSTRRLLGRSVAYVLATLMAAAAGCDGPASAALDPSAKFVPYYVSIDADTARQENTYEAPDGKPLGYVRYYRPGRQAATALVYMHGITSHGAWFGEAADRLAAGGLDVFCLDRRGSGINRENRGYPSGHVDSYETLLGDLHAFLQKIRLEYRRVFLVGLSWGANLAMGNSLTQPKDCDGLVLVTPGLRSRLKPGLGLALKVLLSPSQTPVRIPIDPEMLTVQPTLQQRIASDPLRLRYVTAGFLLEHRKLLERIDRDIARNRHPVLLVLAGKDRIIDNEGVIRVLLRGGQERLDIILYSEQTHSLQLDIPERLTAAIQSWVADVPNSNAEGKVDPP